MRPAVWSYFTLKRPRIALYRRIGPPPIHSFQVFYSSSTAGRSGVYLTGVCRAVKRCFLRVRETLRWTLRWTLSATIQNEMCSLGGHLGGQNRAKKWPSDTPKQHKKCRFCTKNARVDPSNTYNFRDFSTINHL